MNDSMNDFEIIDYVCGGMLARHQMWRSGQGFFNALALVRPDLAEKIRGSELDPFHDNNKVIAAVKWLKEELAKEMPPRMSDEIASDEIVHVACCACRVVAELSLERWEAVTMSYAVRCIRCNGDVIRFERAKKPELIYRPWSKSWVCPKE